MEIHFDPHHSAFNYSFDSLFTLHASRRWTVTPNQSHGEIGFCDLWPAGAFVAARGGRKKYSSCLVEQSGRSIRLPHLHADTGARENILLLPGDKFGWVLEEENPVVEILGPEGVYAGLCAYMWDAHFGLRASGLHNGTELRGPAEFHARFRLSSLGREEGEDWWKRASAASEPELSTMPVVEPGVNRFVRTMADAAAAGEVAWPWSREQEGEGSFARDASIGRSDSCSLRIDRRGAGFGRWCATSIGPAFGGKEFVEGSRYRLSAWVRLEKPGAEARLAIRLHREDAEGLFDPDTYEKWYSECAAATGEWCPLEVVTPVIGAHPDRLHLLLELRDGGRAWFDDVEWEELPPEPA